MSTTIEILLATYNGDRYLRKQLDSIVSQTDSDWRLIFRDDCSSDNTPAIIADYAARDPERILQLDNGRQNLGARGNFAALLEASTAEYIMLADQDDVWLPHKIAVTRQKMKEMEQRYGSDTPLMVFTNQAVVDESDSRVLSDSVWRYQRLNPRMVSRLNRLLLHNIVTGSTMMLNRPLCSLALPVPVAAYMHDWWITLVAATFGRIDYLVEPTMRYRQHVSNVVGAEQWSLPREICRYLSPSRRLERIDTRERLLSKYRAQASAFLIRYGASLPAQVRTMVEIFATLDTYGLAMQKYYILKYRFFYSSPVVTAGMIMLRW
jgi:glycosyltransferase involved in cell wall biosynthesis